MNRTLKRSLIALGALLGLAVVAGAGFVGFHVYRYGASMDTVYAVPVPKVARATPTPGLARGNPRGEARAAGVL